MNPKAVAKGFDRVSSIYDFVARCTYGNALRKAQAFHLAQLPKGAKVLVLGGGTGWFLEALLRHSAPSQVDYVELSPKMIALSQKRLQQNFPQAFAQVNFVLGGISAIPSSEYDLVCTHCFLDVFPEETLEPIVVELLSHMKADGVWHFSDFRKANRFPMWLVSRGLIWAMYRVFHWVCAIPARRLPNFHAVFERQKLREVDRRLFFGGMIEAGLFCWGDGLMEVLGDGFEDLTGRS
jgi:tRNA (cmo5U34)-methyltransferase